MAFDAARYPDAVTFGWVIEKGMDVGLHCHPCGRHVVVPVRSLLPACAGRFKMHALRITSDRSAAGVAEPRRAVTGRGASGGGLLMAVGLVTVPVLCLLNRMITLTRVGEANAGLFVFTIERQGAEPERWLTRAEAVRRLIALGVEEPESLVATAAERGKVLIHEHQ